MYEFEYHKPTSLDEATALLSAKSDPKLMAGGMSLLPTLKLRLAKYSDIVDLAALDGLKGIERIGEMLVIGAMTRHVEVESSEVVRQTIPALANLAAGIGDPLVRNRGTMGGSIANADPGADYPAAVLALGATLTTNKRNLPADDFFKGMFETALESGEIITSVKYLVPTAAAYLKFPNPASRFALVGVFVAKFPGRVRVAVTGAAPAVFRLEDAEAVLSKRFEPAAIDGLVIDSTDLNSDLHATAEYRAHVIAVMLKRAIEAASGINI